MSRRLRPPVRLGCTPFSPLINPSPTRRHFLQTAAAAAVHLNLAPHVVSSVARAAAPADAAWATFQQRPTEARASTFWWWKGKLAFGEMRRQLRVLKGWPGFSYREPENPSRTRSP